MSNEKTKWIFDDADSDGTPSELTETLDGAGAEEATHVGNNEPTVHLSPSAPAGSDKTQIFTRGNADQFAEISGFSEDSDPVTGWLVVVKGPGLGQSVSLGSGMNTVGRGKDARVSLPFGDTLISSEDHIRIIYDDADRAFFVSHGSGKNISRVNGQLLANTLALETDSVIELSKVTKVVFKQFCSQDFDWSDLDQSAAKAE